MEQPILVVDDDAGIRQTIGALLREEGYRVSLAVDGLDALEQVAGGLPALILLDITMPRMDGYAFAEELQRRGLAPAVPILLLTADASAPEKARRVGAAGFVAKPFDLDELLDAVTRALDGG